MDNLAQFEAVKEAADLTAYCDAHLERQGKTYICPVCGSGKGPHRSSAFSIYGDGGRKDKWRCFSCNNGGDVFDLAGYVEGIDQEDHRGKLEAVARWAGVALDDEPGEGRRKKAGTKRKSQPLKAEGPGQDAVAPDAADKAVGEVPEGVRLGRVAEESAMLAWRDAMTDECEGMAYMQSRGFTPDEVRALGIGWMPDKRRVVIPYRPGGGGYYHTDRRVYETDSPYDHKYLKPSTELVGPEPLFHADSIGKGDVFFVVEGQLDALAVEACGYPAAALGTSSTGKVADEVRRRGYKGAAVVLTDADKTGDMQRQGIIDSFAATRCTAFAADIRPTGAKDAAELFARDRNALKSLLDAAAEEGRAKVEARYIESLADAGMADSFKELRSIAALEREERPIPTGIASLDAALAGGLWPGKLAVVGGLSSMGKTTACLQMADKIASRGRPVLFASLEQGARELICKSLSRIARTEGAVINELSVVSRQAREAWGTEIYEAFARAVDVYEKRIAPYLVILENGEGVPIGVKQIADAAHALAEHCGVPPVVFVDYLQMLSPKEDGMLDRKAVDANVSDLRRLARILETPVVVTATLNRTNYYAPVSLESFKESGGIEYGADVVLGIQPSGMSEEYDRVADKGDGVVKRRMYEIVKATKEKKAERHIEFRVLKQRAGAAEQSAEVTYLPVCNTMFSGIKKCPLPGETSEEVRYN